MGKRSLRDRIVTGKYGRGAWEVRTMLRRRPPPILSIATILGLCACDGGNGAPPPPPSNQPPSFTSAPSVTVPEHSDGIIYPATATDPDGEALAFALAGGAEQSAFRITAAGTPSCSRARPL